MPVDCQVPLLAGVHSIVGLAKILADREINDIAAAPPPACCHNSDHVQYVLLGFGAFRRLFRSRGSLLFENSCSTSGWLR
jgi:hypothetical protein